MKTAIASVFQQARPLLSLNLVSWRGNRLPRHDFLHSYGIAISLALLVALVTIGDPAFLSLGNITNMLGQWAPAGIMAVAMTYVVIARGFDLSISSGFSLCAIAAATTAAQGYGIAASPSYGRDQGLA